MFGRLLIVAWALLVLFVLALVISPRAVASIPHLGLFRPFFIILFLVTVGFLLRRLYVGGMKRSG